MTFVDEYPFEAKISRLSFATAFVTLGLGGLFGIIQALHRTGYYRGFISNSDYYAVLTGHGVFLALGFTTFFIVGLYNWGVTESLERGTPSRRFSWLWFGTMYVGTLLAAIPIFGSLLPFIPGDAAVLFTFYAPLQAHPVFYLGAALLIVGSWLAGAQWIWTFLQWRKDNANQRIPLRTFMVLTTWLMWYLSSLGVAIEVLVFLLPWSLGLISTVDPLLTRTLFWYFGHPVVYFWLLPAYFVWYTILPKLAGGRLLSDPLARVVFVLFVLLSTPTGFHHQYLDPGIPEGFKFVAMTNTMFLLLPSLLTAFTVVASIEYGARRRGGTGIIGWLRALPWGNPAFSGSALAGLMFAAGGFSGMVNAGMNLNYLVHNTLWLPGHFHLTVGTAVALTFMAVSYWLLPQLLGRDLRFTGLAAVQPYLWFIGMTLMSNAMHRAGMLGVPRRTAVPTYEGVTYEGAVGGYGEIRLQIAIGATLLTISLFAFLWVMVATWLGTRDETIAVNSTIPPALSGPDEAPRVLDNLRLWVVIAIALVALTYSVPLIDMIADGALWPGSPPFPV